MSQRLRVCLNVEQTHQHDRLGQMKINTRVRYALRLIETLAGYRLVDLVESDFSEMKVKLGESL